MKTAIGILSVIFTIIFLSGCSNDTVVNNTNLPVPYVLSGNIEEWIYGGNMKLKAILFDTNYSENDIVLDSNIISLNGAFSLNFNVPDDSLLYPITFYSDTFCIVNVTVTPPNTKSSKMVGLGLYNDSILNGDIYRSNYNDTITIPKQFFVHYIYLNQNVSISGSIIRYDWYSNIHDTIIYNFTGYRGWNKIVNLFNSINNNSMKITISSTEPAGGKWFAHVCNGDSIKDQPLNRQKAFMLNKCVSCK